jgi:hypothetical protein
MKSVKNRGRGGGVEWKHLIFQWRVSTTFAKLPEEGALLKGETTHKLN